MILACASSDAHRQQQHTGGPEGPRSKKAKPPRSAPNAIFGAAFALYGAALFGTAKLSQQSWLAGFAWLSFAVAFTLCLFANQSWAYLNAAVGSLLVLLAPGLVLLRREPASVV